MYRIDIMTLFPDVVGDMLCESVLGRGQERGYIRIECHQIRDYTLNKQRQVDDYPYGGGRGAVMQADPLYQCWKHICDEAGERVHTIYMSPAGKTFCQADARRLRDDYTRLILVCGHYEGIDERFIEECVDEEISLGDFVMTGGEHAGGTPVLPARGVARPGGAVHPALRQPRQGGPVAAEAVHPAHLPPPARPVRKAGPVLQGGQEAAL